MRIDSSGRLLVGTSSNPTPSSVVIQGNSTGSTTQAQLWLNRGVQRLLASGDALGHYYLW